ncbi:hypothetical protein SAMN05661044_00937 [Olivibacter domesticus]|uniref:Uncharacterized protein n=1 Tax=Olivibacter domesticus TaxID=407022 RepID=A0A1H7J6Q8_OLID1|nr:hypothetical protein SAMN05661044_00937 [Olivibacter domesticus]
MYKEAVRDLSDDLFYFYSCYSSRGLTRASNALPCLPLGIKFFCLKTYVAYVDGHHLGIVVA